MQIRIGAICSIISMLVLGACSTIKSANPHLDSSSAIKSISPKPGYKFATFCDEYIVEIPQNYEAAEGSELIVSGPQNADGQAATLTAALSSTPSQQYANIDSCVKCLSQGMQSVQVLPKQTITVNGFPFDKVLITGTAPPKADNAVGQPYSACVLWGREPAAAGVDSTVVITWGPDESQYTDVWEKIVTSFRKK